MNIQGLTWDEWAAAAGLPMQRVYARGPVWGFSIFTGMGWPASAYSKERAAWRAGNDPTDWRAKRAA